jgi:glycine rich protein
MPHPRHFPLSWFRCAVLALAFVGAWLAPAVAGPPVALGAQVVHIFSYTGAMQNWTVPAGVHFAHFDVKGAQGGGNNVLSVFPVIPGGEGGRTVAEVRVFPGEVIHIFVGGKGHDGGSGQGHAKGGFNGGGNGGVGVFGDAWGGGGGGASDIRVEGTQLTNRIIVAGGGGGSAEKLDVACGFSIGGGGGGLEAADGVAAVDSCIGGTGGTQTSGGVQAGYPEGRGRLGSGGLGMKCGTVQLACGGGGGGGYYGGGGGAHGAGGGGGSGFGPRVDFPPVKFYTGVHKGNGQVILTFEHP